MEEFEGISLEVDAGEAKDEIAQITQDLQAIEKVTEKIGSTIGKALMPFSKSLKDAGLSIDTMTASLEQLTQKLEKLMAQMAEEQKADQLLGGVSTTIDGLNLVSNSLEVIDKIKRGFGKGDFSLGGLDEEKGSLLEYIAAVKTASPEVGTFSAMFPKLSCALIDAKEALTNVGTAILGVIGDMGKMAAGLAKNTAKWIADTAAKVGNTAAQWAQIAATVAWKGICIAATAVTTAFGAAMTFLTSPIGLVVIGITALIAIIVLLVANWDTVSAKAQEVWGFIQGLFAQFDDFLQNIFAKDFTEQFGAFGHVLNAFFANVENIWNAVKSIFGGIVDFVKNVFAGDWGAAWDSIVGVFKGVWDLLVSVVKAPINGIIGLINMLIASVYSGIADVVNGLGSVVSGVGDMLGLDWGFSIPTTPPQIPYLAQGAVLPANRPFLAMVGDQRHGTNVEAPLTTIQEAVALVMDDYAARNAAGQQATVEMLRNILEAVLGIQIGDDVIGRAALRYNRKMAVARGGF